MLNEQQILISIKKQILQILPDAVVYLFGSRASGTSAAESDWDILVLSGAKKISPALKQAVHNRVFPLSVAMGAFVNLLIVTKQDWHRNPAYYSLKKTVSQNSRAL
ncbi:MAG: nucleotidyltransferase domain-containing protein [Bacteroidota bacterium]